MAINLIFSKHTKAKILYSFCYDQLMIATIIFAVSTTNKLGLRTLNYRIIYQQNMIFSKKIRHVFNHLKKK